MTAAELVPIALIYLVAILSPGPATLAIAATSMQSGRRAGLALAAGVLTGSLTWALIAAFGLGAAISAWAPAMTALKVIGGCYLLWMAYKSARGAMSKTAPKARGASGSLRILWLRGLGIHLTNPKAVLFWGALFSVAIKPGLGMAALAPLLIMCGCLGALCFGGYAVLFSTRRATDIWLTARRPLEGGLAAIFGAAGAGLLLSRAAQH
ncbi:MAG: threonine/homoserine/homoserine lactone efflux protein [Paracoccaceae bacterium]|jgi:threonine efflux protein